MRQNCPKISVDSKKILVDQNYYQIDKKVTRSLKILPGTQKSYYTLSIKFETNFYLFKIKLKIRVKNLAVNP